MRYLIIFLLLFNVGYVNGQASVGSSVTGTYISFSPGLWVPLGGLHKTFRPSPVASVKLSAQGELFKLEIGADFIFNSGNIPFHYESKDTSFMTGDKLTMGDIVVRLSSMKELSPSSYLERSIGIGYSTISTDVKKIKSKCVDYEDDRPLFNNECDGSDKYDYFDVESFILSAGVGLQRVIFTDRVIGVHAEYRFAPYSWFGHVGKGFGNSSLMANVYFRF